MVQISSVAAGVSSFCFPGCKVPAWFVQQNSAASVTIQLMLVGGKTKRCHDNKRDNEADPVEVASRMVQNLPQMT